MSETNTRQPPPGRNYGGRDKIHIDSPLQRVVSGDHMSDLKLNLDAYTAAEDRRTGQSQELQAA